MTEYAVDKTYRKAVVRITDLVAEDGRLDGFLFDGCHISGPAVMVFHSCSITNSNLGGPGADAILWEIPLTRQQIVGVVGALNCAFDNCTFDGIGFAGPPDFIKQLRDGVDA